MPAKKTYDVIPRDEQEQARMETAIEPRPDLYQLMDELIASHHSDLESCRIALVWRYGWKANDDGQVILGQFKKCSSLEVQMHGYDAKILLNYEAWTGVDFSEGQQRALLDHELCHGALKLDKEGDPAVDPNTGRLKYRTRKHDCEEFDAIVERHGLWTGNIRRLAAAAMRGARRHDQMDLFDKSGIESVTFGDGKDAVTFTAEEMRNWPKETIQ